VRSFSRQAASEPNSLLGKGAVDATLSKISGSYLLWSGRGGSFNHRLIGDLNEPPRLRPPKDASQYFLNGRIHPAFYQGGEFGRRGDFMCKAPSLRAEFSITAAQRQWQNTASY